MRFEEIRRRRERNMMWLMCMLIALVIVLIVAAVRARAESAAAMPDRKLTPGATSDLTATQLCDPKFHTGAVRAVKHSVHVAVFKEYGIDCAKVACGKSYEVDHLISLELGGSNDIKNLWPEPYEPAPGAHQKDVVENWLHRQVCAGAISLEDAQHQISTDWFAVYRRMTSSQQKQAVKRR
jgi:hypothetical protein